MSALVLLPVSTALAPSPHFCHFSCFLLTSPTSLSAPSSVLCLLQFSLYVTFSWWPPSSSCRTCFGFTSLSISFSFFLSPSLIYHLRTKSTLHVYHFIFCTVPEYWRVLCVSFPVIFSHSAWGRLDAWETVLDEWRSFSGELPHWSSVAIAQTDALIPVVWRSGDCGESHIKGKVLYLYVQLSEES